VIGQFSLADVVQAGQVTQVNADAASVIVGAGAATLVG
jgi:hypothetical protein